MSETPAIYLETMPPTKLTFLAFTWTQNREAAMKIFFDRYGQPPANIIEYKRNLYLGPIPERESEK